MVLLAKALVRDIDVIESEAYIHNWWQEPTTGPYSWRIEGGLATLKSGWVERIRPSGPHLKRNDN